MDEHEEPQGAHEEPEPWSDAEIAGRIAGAQFREDEEHYDAVQALIQTPEARLARHLQKRFEGLAEVLEDPSTPDEERELYASWVFGVEEADWNKLAENAKNQRGTKFRFLLDNVSKVAISVRARLRNGLPSNAAHYAERLLRAFARRYPNDANAINVGALQRALEAWPNTRPGVRSIESKARSKYALLSRAIENTSFATSPKMIAKAAKALRRPLGR